MATPDECRRQKARIFEETEKLPLLDAVATILHYNFHDRNFGGHCPPIPLSVLEHRASSAEIDDAQSRFEALYWAGFAVGDAYVGHNPKAREMRLALQEAHPDFLERSYDMAIDPWRWRLR